MTALTHAVFDATTSEQASPAMTTEAAFAECAKLNRDHGGGYVVGPVKWKPPPSAVKAAIERTEDEDGFTLATKAVKVMMKPEAPCATVAQNPEGPGLFD